MQNDFGQTIQLYLVDGAPNGLIVASIHGWTGSLLVASQATFDRLLARSEMDRTGIYILHGPDPDNPLGARAYIGEADIVQDRIGRSAGTREFWETAVVITTSDDALTKGHVRYLEARLIEMTRAAGRVTLDNDQKPSSDRRRLPESDKANMEAFLANLKVILPVIGLDMLKPQPKITLLTQADDFGLPTSEVQFELRHKSNVKAYAVEEDEEFIVLKGSEALRDTGYAKNSYARLKGELIAQGILVPNEAGERYAFSKPYSFKSPSAAGSVILDRNTNGRTRWFVLGDKATYHEWQEQKARQAVSAAQL